RPSRSRCACASTSPGITAAPRTSSTRVRRSRHGLMSARPPAAMMRPPAMASAPTTGRRASSVRTRALSRIQSAAIALPTARAASAASVRRHHLVEESPQLAALVPRGQAQRHVPEAGPRVVTELRRAGLGIARDRPLLDELRGEVGRVVCVEKLLRLLEPGLTVLVDVDVVIERAADRLRIAAFLLGHRADATELLGELRWAQLVRHPAIRELRDAPEPALDDLRSGARPLFPREPRRIRGDPDGHRLLPGLGLAGDGVELVEGAQMRRLGLAEERFEDDDPVLQTRHGVGGGDAHHAVLRGLRGVGAVGAAETDGEPGAALAELVEARPLLGKEHRMA